MGMQFTITVNGDISAECDVDALALDETLNESANDLFDIGSDIDVRNVRASGTVTLNAEVCIADVEVEAKDMAEFDAEEYLRERVDSFSGNTVEQADFEVTDEPTGFDTVVEAVGYDRDLAIKVYAALDAAGYSVNW